MHGKRFRPWATVSALSLALAWAAAVRPAGAAPPTKPAAGKVAAVTPSPITPVPVPPRPVDPLDWPGWRGPEQNGISRETGLIDRWDPDGGADGNVLWKNTELAGISSPIVLGGKLYTIVRDQPDTKREMEKVVCVDAATGKKLWENKFYVYLSDVPAERVGWSSCVADPTTGRIYALGVCGYFQCIDGDSGRTIWSRSLSEEFGLLSTYGGRTNVPVLHEDKVLISAVTTNWGDFARPAHRFMAFDKNTGEMFWFAGTKLAPEDTTYSTPVVSRWKDWSRWSSARATAESGPSSRGRAKRIGPSSFRGAAQRFAGCAEGHGRTSPTPRRMWTTSTQGPWSASTARQRRHHQDGRTVAGLGDGRQELAATRRRPGLCLRRRRQDVCLRCHDRRGSLQTGQADRHDRPRQPGVCRRQDIHLHDGGLARLSADQGWGETDPQAAAVGE